MPMFELAWNLPLPARPLLFIYFPKEENIDSN